MTISSCNTPLPNEQVTMNLSAVEIQHILSANGKRKRKVGPDLTPKYRAKQQKLAESILTNWVQKGLPANIRVKLECMDSPLLRTFEFPAEHSLIDQQQNLGQACYENQHNNHQSSNQNADDGKSCSQAHNVNSSDTFCRNASSSSDEIISPISTDDDEDASFGLQRGRNILMTEESRRTITFKRLLQHFAVYTNQTKEKMTYFLRLFKHFRPRLDYDDLPSTGAALLKINADDFPQTSSQDHGNKKKLPPTSTFNDGKYVHFGLENGITGKSPGIVFQNSDLLQFVGLYKKEPKILPKTLKRKIEFLDRRLQIERAVRSISCNELNDEQTAMVQTGNALPHFEIEINIDGVAVMNNSDQGSLIPILALVHSVNSFASSSEKPRKLTNAHPFIVGFYYGKEKPDINRFLQPLLNELKRLSPDCSDPELAAGREFTVKLRCLICDTPMRTYLKRCKGHSGYWACERCIQRGKAVHYPGFKKSVVQFLELDAPLRRDDEFLTYYRNEQSEDDHLPSPEEVSPFTELDFPMVSGFVIDAMHTFFAGAFAQRLKGIVSLRHEGRVSTLKLNQIERRLTQFRKCKLYEFDRHVRGIVGCVNKYKFHELRQFLYYLLFPVFKGILNDSELENLLRLQYAMLLLGGCNPNPVSTCNINRARSELKEYVRYLTDAGYPIRISTHEIVHIPDDVLKYECGVECIAAWKFESFQRVFKALLRSGNLPAEQIRNRLIERSKYMLPTGMDGLVLCTSHEFEKEALSVDEGSSLKNILIEFTCRGEKWPKKLRFSTFTLSNKFPNNVCFLKNGSIVVVRDISEFPKGSGSIIIVCHKFRTVEDAFDSPYRSSEFQTFIASRLCHRVYEWSIDMITSKAYALPYKTKGSIDIYNPSEKWYVAPLRHTTH